MRTAHATVLILSRRFGYNSVGIGSILWQHKKEAQSSLREIGLGSVWLPDLGSNQGPAD
jgi:hypothetical protein